MPTAKAEFARRELARRRFIDFIQFMSPSYQAEWVHRALASALERFLEGVRLRQSPRLMVFMPPRHGKSEQVSRYFPAWAFGHNSDLSMIASSYAADLIARMNRDIQRIMDEPRYGNIFEDDDEEAAGRNREGVSETVLRFIEALRNGDKNYADP